MHTVGVIGLGNMGFGMAATLQRAEVAVMGFDPSAAATEKANAAGISCAATIAELCAKCDVIILSLPNAAIVRAVALGEGGILENGTSGLLVLETSTSEPAVTREIAQAFSEKEISILDAPVSGGPTAAHAGTMTMLLGGSEQDVARAKSVTDILAATVVHVGGHGAGHVAKLANNMLCAANLVLVSEAVRLAHAAGVKPEEVLAGVNAGSGRSAVSEVNFPRWVLNGAFDSGFSMGLMRKDVGLAAKLAAECGVELQAFAGIERLWRQDSTADIADAEDFNRIVAHGAPNDLFQA